MSQNVIDNETQEKLDAFIKQEEGDSNDYKGVLAKFITLVAVGMSLFHLYAAYSIVPTQQLRVIHVALVLFLVFLSFPIAHRFRNRLMWWDVLFAIAPLRNASRTSGGVRSVGLNPNDEVVSMDIARPHDYLLVGQMISISHRTSNARPKLVKIDAFFWVGGLPTAAVTDLANSPGMKIVMVDTTDEIPAMNKKYGNLYFPTVIPKATYSGMAKDNKVAAVANILVVNANMSDADAYKIVKAIFDNKLELVRTHQEYMNVNLENQKQKSTPIDFHAGALKFFKEKNVKVN